MKETINTAGGAQQNQPLVGRVTSAQQKRHVVLMATKETSGFSSGRNPKLLAVVSSYVPHFPRTPWVKRSRDLGDLGAKKQPMYVHQQIIDTPFFLRICWCVNQCIVG